MKLDPLFLASMKPSTISTILDDLCDPQNASKETWAEAEFIELRKQYKLLTGETWTQADPTAKVKITVKGGVVQHVEIKYRHYNVLYELTIVDLD